MIIETTYCSVSRHQRRADRLGRAHAQQERPRVPRQQLCERRAARGLHQPLLVVGFYLINMGYVTLALKLGDKPASTQGAIEFLSTKVGLVLLVLGAMHFFNVFVDREVGQARGGRDPRVAGSVAMHRDLLDRWTDTPLFRLLLLLRWTRRAVPDALVRVFVTTVIGGAAVVMERAALVDARAGRVRFVVDRRRARRSSATGALTARPEQSAYGYDITATLVVPRGRHRHGCSHVGA